MKLSEIVTGNLYDATTGNLLADSAGMPDAADEYDVLRRLPSGAYLVRGPSGQTDRTDPTDHSRLHRGGK